MSCQYCGDPDKPVAAVIYGQPRPGIVTVVDSDGCRVRQEVIERIETKNGHYYKIDGKRAIGVTTALNGIPKGALVPWAARQVAEWAVDNHVLFGNMLDAAGRGPTVRFLTEVPSQERDEAAGRGTEIHALAEEYVLGKEIEVPTDLLPYVEGYAQYVNDFNPASLHTELTVASREFGYAGTLDSIEDIPGYGRCLVDWKTGKGVYGEFALQVAAYRHAEVMVGALGDEHDMPAVDRTFILHIQPGGYDLIPVQADGVAFTKFLVALENYRENVQSNKLDKLIGEPVRPIEWEAA